MQFLTALESLGLAWGTDAKGAAQCIINALSTLTPASIKPQASKQQASSQAAASKKVWVSVYFNKYDKRTNSAPWIATIAQWPEGGKPEYTFLNDAWKGDASSGGCIDAELAPGTIIRVGQRNYRNKGASRLEWRVVNSDGSTTVIGVAVRDLWLMSLTSNNA